MLRKMSEKISNSPIQMSLALVKRYNQVQESHEIAEGVMIDS